MSPSRRIRLDRGPATPPGPAIQPKSRSPLTVDELARQLQRRVVTGDIPLGSWLRQEHLASEFGVSRTPVREAIRQLQANGIVELVPNRGALVRGPSLHDIYEAYVVRAELEGLAAELAASLIEDDELIELYAAEEMCAAAASSFAQLTRGEREVAEAAQGWVDADDRFHQTVQAVADNSRLQRAIADLHLSFPHSLTARPLVEDPRLLQAKCDEHRAVKEALADHDPARARAAMREHVRRAGDLVAWWFAKWQDAEPIA